MNKTGKGHIILLDQTLRRSSSLHHGDASSRNRCGPRRIIGIMATLSLLLSLGFVIHYDYYVFDKYASLSNDLVLWSQPSNSSQSQTSDISTIHSTQTTMPNVAKIESNAQEKPSSAIDVRNVAQCTPEQLSTIKKQLPPDDCIKNEKQPWGQECSHTYATKCPDAVWLEEFYTQLHSSRRINNTFVSIFIGCNKGMDAVNAMRMGSGNPLFDKSEWKNSMTKGGKIKLDRDVCNQASTPQFALPESVGGLATPQSPLSQMHCVEPMPATARALKQSAQELGWDQRGFVVTQAAVSRRDGVVPFPAGFKVGKENKGIGNCSPNSPDCVNVTMYSLDTFVSNFIPEGVPINYLSVDVEGFDMDVLLGGSSTLSRVQYLEFEYNWMGSWANQKLSSSIEWLNDYYGFTCYWPGFDNTVWRITGCWLDHYDIHFWSNVACVNRNVEETLPMAERMEQMFLDTLERGNDAIRDFEHRFKRKDE